MVANFSEVDGKPGKGSACLAYYLLVTYLQ